MYEFEIILGTLLLLLLFTHQKKNRLPGTLSSDVQQLAEMGKIILMNLFDLRLVVHILSCCITQF